MGWGCVLAHGPKQVSCYARPQRDGRGAERLAAVGHLPRPSRIHLHRTNETDTRTHARGHRVMASGPGSKSIESNPGRGPLLIRLVRHRSPEAKRPRDQYWLECWSGATLLARGQSTSCRAAALPLPLASQRREATREGTERLFLFRPAGAVRTGGGGGGGSKWRRPRCP